MTVGDWLITMLLLMIPIVNFVLLFVWAFGGNVNPSKKAYFRAYLIIMAIVIVLTILFGALFGGFIFSLTNFTNWP